MSKVLIDRELAERVCHVDNSTRQTARRELRTILATPSGTPAMPVKAYYHEWTDLEGVRTRSVGLEVRKEFTDAPLVLESDALARIACLEGEIAKRDEELAACRVAVENCEVFRARIVELESDLAGTQSRVLVLQDQWRQLDAELAAINAQEPTGWYTEDHLDDKSATTYSLTVAERWVEKGWPVSPLYAAPVSEAKAHSVVMPERWNVPRPMWKDARQPYGNPLNHADIEAAEKFNLALDEVARLNAAPVQQVSVPQCVFDWFEAKQAHVNAVDAYNARLAFVREHMPFGTSIDPEYKIMEAADRKARILIGAMFSGLRDLAAAPAAPAADAGIVDMYRHLQKVTPYRFKKIQDASITDGGDVMYFHKDRFDAALLADMAAHCAAKGVV